MLSLEQGGRRSSIPAPAGCQLSRRGAVSRRDAEVS